MSFWDSILQFFGVTGVTVKLNTPPTVSKSERRVTGTVTLATTKLQQILSIRVILEESWSTGSGADRETKDFELGLFELEDAFTLEAGETRQLPFSFEFDILKSSNDRLKDQGGLMGALGSVGSWMDSEKSTYRVKATANVQGTAIDPGETRNVKLVD